MTQTLILLVQGLVFNTESVTNVSLDQFSVQPLLKILLYLIILALPPTLNLDDLGFIPIASVKAWIGSLPIEW